MGRAMRLSRRFVLRGAGGAALGLPLLECMRAGRAHAANVEPRRRFVVWSMPNGTVSDRWVCPVGRDETDFTMSEILAPLERHRADMIGLQNLQQFGGHAHHLAASLTGRKFVDRGHPRIYATGISVDQHLAAKWEGRTPVPSLQVGVAVKQNQETCAAASWAAAGRALPPENNPFAIHSRLFGGVSAAGTRQAISLRRSLLDRLLPRWATLAQRLGRADRGVVDNYLESVRAVEKQMEALERRAGRCAPARIGADPTLPGARPWWLDNDNVPQIMNVQIDLVAAILACDLTRVITFNVASDGGAYRMHPWIPETPKGADWHSLSHAVERGEEAGMIAAERWYYRRLADLLDRLKSHDEGNGTLLGSSLVFVNNEYGPNGGTRYLDGGEKNLSHYSRLMPYLVFGQAGGSVRTGRWLAYPFNKDGTGTHHTQLLVGILNALGVPDHTFGDPEAMQGPLPRLL